jgi:hypothetical protein
MSIKSRLTRTLNVLLNKKYKTNEIVYDRGNNFLDIILNKLGNKISHENQSCIDGNHNPIPWFTYPSIEYLNQLNLKEYNVLEWGCGNSTKYFSKRTNHINSIESNIDWFNNIKNLVNENVTIHFKDSESDYVNFPLSLNIKFDIIVIDGIFREGCVDTALKLHSKKCFIILDNSDRYPELCKIIRHNDYLEVDFHGFGPINNYSWTTSLFYPNQGMQKLIPITNQPKIPAGGGY